MITHPFEDLACINIEHLVGLSGSCALHDRHDNFGFEINADLVEGFEQRWGEDCEEHVFTEIYCTTPKMTTLDHFFDFLSQFQGECNDIWLIDYRLQPTANFDLKKVTEGENGRVVFRARDRYFVEVQKSDIKSEYGDSIDANGYWWDAGGEYWERTIDGKKVRSDAFTFAGNVYDFIEELNIYAFDEDLDEAPCPAGRVGVLGYIIVEEW